MAPQKYLLLLKSSIYESLWHYDLFLYIGRFRGIGWRSVLREIKTLSDTTSPMILNKLL